MTEQNTSDTEQNDLLAAWNGECDPCERDTGQGGVYPIEELNRSVCASCLQEIKQRIDRYVDTGNEQ